MQWDLVVAIAIVIPICLLPVAFIYYLNFGWVLSRAREREARKVLAVVRSRRVEMKYMRRVAHGALFFLAGVLFPILIWVALFVALRKPILQALKRLAYGALFILAGILFPVLIWIGLFVAIRMPLLEATKKIASVLLALLAGILFPVLIWAGLFVSVNQWLRERVLWREPARTIDEILSAAGLTVQWQVAAGRSTADALFIKQPMPEIRELLTRAGLEMIYR